MFTSRIKIYISKYIIVRGLHIRWFINILLQSWYTLIVYIFVYIITHLTLNKQHYQRIKRYSHNNIVLTIILWLFKCIVQCTLSHPNFIFNTDWSKDKIRFVVEMIVYFQIFKSVTVICEKILTMFEKNCSINRTYFVFNTDFKKYQIRSKTYQCITQWV